MYRSPGGKGTLFCSSGIAVVSVVSFIFACHQDRLYLKQPALAAFLILLPSRQPGPAVFGSPLAGSGIQICI